MSTKSPASRWLKLAAVLVLIAVIITVFATGAYERIDPVAIQLALQDAGIWGAVLFVVAFGLIQPLHISAHVFIIAATLVWPPGEALLYAWLGSMAAAATCYGFGAWVGEEWISERLPDRFAKRMGKVQDHSFKSTLGVKLLFFTTPSLQMAFGAFKVDFRKCMAATGIAHAIYIIPEVLLGDQIAAWASTVWGG
ncbi:MAG: putative membrane protein YdjX (TVP38/TMEM64 family) [Cognaticolwellia sp.]